MKKTVIYVLAECLAYDRTADLTIHGAFTSLDKAKAIMLEKIEERFNYIKDDLCDNEEEWKHWVNARFWNTVEDNEHKMAWSDDDGDTVSKFFIDEVEVGFEESEKTSKLENNKEIEIPEGYDARIDGNKVIIEQKESEDERIRKGLENFLWCIANGGMNDRGTMPSAEMCQKWLACLERMKEHQPNIELIQRSWYLEGYHDSEFGKEPKWIIKTGEGGPEYEENPKYGQMLKEQKPAECIADSIKFDEGFKTGKEVGFREGVESVKPAEWSEEDKLAIDRACVALRAYSNGDLPEFLPSELLGYADRLQSLLSPQPHWKPSEEHMEELLNALIPGKDFDCDILAELYEQLKELM